MSKSTLQRYETGFIKNIPLSRVEALAKALRVTPEYLMGWEEKSEAPVMDDENAPNDERSLLPPGNARAFLGQP